MSQWAHISHIVYITHSIVCKTNDFVGSNGGFCLFAFVFEARRIPEEENLRKKGPDPENVSFHTNYSLPLKHLMVACKFNIFDPFKV